MTDVSAELSAFFDTGVVSEEAYERLADLGHTTFQARERLAELTSAYRQQVEQGQGEALKLGLALLVLGRFREALDALNQAPDSKFRRFYAAKAALGLGRHDQAAAEFRQAAAKGWDEFEVDMLVAAVQVQKGDPGAAEKLLQKHAQVGQDRAGWYHVRGLLEEQAGEWAKACESYERALTLDPDHSQAMFHCARLYDQRGEDEQAIEIYQRLALQPRAYVNALMNLAVIYEDIGRYDEALDCLRRVLKAYPNHTRARLFYKDVESCRQMVLEEAGDQRAEPRNRLLDTPISDFELSVRARNCLKKMDVRTLGDLIKLSEAELLSYKNFGDTSLEEIKALLAKRGLRLGQPVEEIEALGTAPPPAVPVPPGREAVLNKPVSELELSVRARRCLQRLNVVTLGDLIKLTEPDLLATRNFGVTSLNEVKARLAEHGLQLSDKRVD